MTAPKIPRRAFLRNAMALSSLGLASRLDLVNFLSAADATTAPSYQALVCVFLYGGNDGNNTVVPLDTAGYGSYSAVRNAASGIQLTQAQLLPIQPANTATPFGLHPALTQLQTLFGQGKLAIVANVGTLTQPTTLAQYQAGIQPLSLYSHFDQQTQWQNCDSTAVATTGWGGRIADQTRTLNTNGFPVVTSLAGATLYTAGAAAQALSVPASGSFALAGYGNNAAANARLAAVKTLLAQPSTSTMVTEMNQIGNQALTFSSVINPVLTGTSTIVDPLFSGLSSSIATQLHQVAKLISARTSTGATRQIFFVSQSSYDTHNNQLAQQNQLFSDLSPALGAFYNATVALGVGGQVTTFTLSDFCRTFAPASGAGTDHAWGNHHFVLGDAVAGGNFYGQYPELALGGPDDTTGEGRWIPTTSVDQYGATLASWFGVSSANLVKVFPNLGAFPTKNLGFLG